MPTQTVCTNDWYLFNKYVQKIFSDFLCTNISKICTSCKVKQCVSLLFSRFKCVESKVLSNHWIHWVQISLFILENQGSFEANVNKV